MVSGPLHNPCSDGCVDHTDHDRGGNGWFGVGGGGCDYQFKHSDTWDVVIGAFGDYDFMNIKGSLAGPFSTAFSGNENERSAWSAGARAGLLVTPTLLTYVNGGYTQTSFDQVNFANAAGVGAFSLSSNTYNGWFLGGGTEYAVTWLPIPGLFWRNEYRYSSYSNANVGIVATATSAPTAFNLRRTRRYRRSRRNSSGASTGRRRWPRDTEPILALSGRHEPGT